MRKKREINPISIAFLDLLSGALGAVIILFVAMPKGDVKKDELKKAKIDYENEIKTKEARIKELEKNNKMLSEEIELQDKTIAFMSEEKNKKVEVVQTAGKPIDVGFKFKGKKVVFLIDVSGSMVEENRIGQVKAGLKMLITTMGEEFSVDVVYFPGKGRDSLYTPLWGMMKPMNNVNKSHVYNFLQDLNAFGPTPTREAIRYSLIQYTGMSDLVVLSDGAPTVGVSKIFDDIKSVLAEVSSLNSTRHVQINTIGVGRDFLEDKKNDKYVFLNDLAQQNDGFFVGF